jgi:DHA2 family multidrug resistance protein
MWDDRAAMHHAHLTEPLSSGQGAFDSVLASLQATGLSAQQALAQVNRMIDQQAFTRAADDIFYGSALLFLALIGLIWFTKRPPKIGGAPADAGGAH